MRNFILISVIIFCIILPCSSNAECISVKNAQQILKKLNYYPDIPDGILGRSTKKIIKTFQMDYNIPMTGRLDKKTCKKLISEQKKLKKTSAEIKTPKKTEGPSKDKTINKLYELGYLVKSEKIPGKTELREALIIFQSENNIPPTGLEDETTLRKLFSDDAKKYIPLKSEKNKFKPLPQKKLSKNSKKTEVKKKIKCRYIGYNISYIDLGIKSLYDTSSFEANNETLNKANYSKFLDDKYFIHYLYGGNEKFNITAIGGSGADYSNNLYGVDLTYYFNLKRFPFLINLRFSDFKTEIISQKGYSDEKEKSLSTQEYGLALLYRNSEKISYGFNISYSRYPTLVTIKNTVDQMRGLFLDEDFELTTIDAEFNFNSMGKKTRYLNKNFKKFTPYFSLKCNTGFTDGKVSSGVEQAAADVLNSSISGEFYGLNLAAEPETGINYRLHTDKYDINFKLGYRAEFKWPLWNFAESPFNENSDTIIKIYRKDILHGPILGCELIF